MASILVHCQPGARQTGLAELHDGKPKIRLKAPAVEGQANRALIDFLAERCGTPRSAVSISSGAGSRIKRVVVEGISEEQLRAALGL